jgi:hypothetical protein
MSAQTPTKKPEQPSLALWATARARSAAAGVERPSYEPARVEKVRVPVDEWIEERVYDHTTVNKVNWDFSQAKRIRLQDFQRRILKKVLTPDSRGFFPYRTIIWSQPKKSGKTQIAGAVGARYADQVESPNVVLTMANDREQSAGLIFASMLPTLHALGCKVPTHATSKPEVRMPNGTVIQAIANNYAGAAGGNYGLTLWSELWAYTSERSRRLFDELVPVPTRKNSIRWVETYAGFEDESDLLLSIFLRIFTDTNETHTQPNARPVPGLEDIQTDGHPACWEVPEAGLFVFWDHEHRLLEYMQGSKDRAEQFIREQEADLRLSTFIRLWQNRWQSTESQFITPEMYRKSVRLQGERLSPMVLAGDASQRNDTTALVGMERIIVNILGRPLERFRSVFCRVWNPQGQDIDLEATIAAEVKRIHDFGMMVGPFWYDPTQMHQVAVNLRKAGVPCAEFNQGTERMRADSFLHKLYKQGRIDNYPHAELGSHVTSARAVEDKNEGIRIVKGTLSQKGKHIDAAVAQSMATWKASTAAFVKPKKRRSTSTSMI